MGYLNLHFCLYNFLGKIHFVEGMSCLLLFYGGVCELPKED